MPTPGKLFPLSAIAALLHMTPEALRRYAVAGRLEVVKLGPHKTYVSEAAFRKFLEQENNRQRGGCRKAKNFVEAVARHSEPPRW